MAKCSKCNKNVDLVRSTVKKGVHLKDVCDPCLGSFRGFADKARAFERDWQKRHYAKDLVQPWEKEYISAYGADKAREAGWNEEAIRKYT